MAGGDAQHPAGPGDILCRGELQQVLEKFHMPGSAAVFAVQQFFQIQEQDQAVPGGDDIRHHRDPAEGVGLGESLPHGNMVEDDAVSPQVGILNIQLPGQKDAELGRPVAGAKDSAFLIIGRPAGAAGGVQLPVFFLCDPMKDRIL